MANYTMTIEEMLNHPLTSKIFPEHYPFYVDDEKARKEFEEKFISYFYYREIGFETPFMFRQRLQSLLMMRMPYWKQLYETELEAKNINFLLNKDLKETFIRELAEENQSTGQNSYNQSSTSTNSGTQSSNGNVNQTTTSSVETSQTDSSNNLHKESSIRDGIAVSSLSEGYLTGTSSDTAQANQSGTSDTTSQNTTTDTTSQTLQTTASDTTENTAQSTQQGNTKASEKTELISQGNIGITSSAQLLKEWREVLINMDEIIIKECEKLFMKLY